jgi:single-strand DNA-binding protein
MNSFTITAVGNVARDPERGTHAAGSYTRICLVGSDIDGRDEHGQPRETVTSAWFVAFGKLGDILARNVRTGDQLVLQAQMRNNTRANRDGKRQYELSFVIQQFRFGAPGRATRQVMAARQARSLVTPF